MSAFYCNDSVITKCVTAVLKYAGDRFANLPMTRHDESRLGSAVGTALREINVEALKQRYPGRLSEHELNTSYEFSGRVDAHPAVLLKALQCLQYQCAEGNVPETVLYRELGRVIDLVVAAEGPLTGTPEYERAPWGG